MDDGADRLLRAGVNLRNDHLTGELLAGLAASGARAILLKGASVRRLLYDDDRQRVSVDIDVLVDPGAVGAVEERLPALGFAFVGVDTVGRGRDHDRVWRHLGTGVPLEIHTTIAGIGAPAGHVWRELSCETAEMVVGDRPVEILGDTARAFHIALNVAHHGRLHPATMGDLERALEVISPATWEAAARLAERLDASAAFSAGLALHPAGRELLGRLGLGRIHDPLATLRAETAPPLAQGLGWLAGLPTGRARVVFAARAAFPPPGFMRIWSPLAARGPAGLALAYCWRPLWILLRLPAAVRAWRRARAPRG